MEGFYSILMDLTFTIKNYPLGGINDLFLEHTRYRVFHPMYCLYYAWKTNLGPYLDTVSTTTVQQFVLLIVNKYSGVYHNSSCYYCQ